MILKLNSPGDVTDSFEEKKNVNFCISFFLKKVVDANKKMKQTKKKVENGSTTFFFVLTTSWGGN